MSKTADLRIEILGVDQLQEYENNARQHGEIDIAAIRDSIEAFGFNDPIGIWSEDNVIVEGHGRLAAAKELGCRVLPYDERFPNPDIWQVIDNSVAAEILQQQLDIIDR